MKRETVVIGGRSLATATLGTVGKDRPTLIFLHEGLGSIGQWRDYPAKLSAALGLPALLYDRWGFGGSDPLQLPRPRDYLHQEAEETLPALLRCFGIEKPILYGQSDGGSIALLFAAAFPDWPQACITEAAHVFVEEMTLEGIREADQLYKEGDLGQRLSKYHGNKTDRMFRGWTETWLRADFRDWEMTGLLPSITCPCLVLQGEKDPYGSPAQVEAIANGIAGLGHKMLIADCGHAPFREFPALTMQAVQDFLKSALGPGFLPN